MKDKLCVAFVLGEGVYPRLDFVQMLFQIVSSNPIISKPKSGIVGRLRRGSTLIGGGK